MAKSIAQRRAARAVKRKHELKARRVAEPAGLAANIRHYAGCPLHACVMTADGFATGMAAILLARRAPNGQLAVAAFLVDLHATGVKNCFFRVIESSEFAEWVESASGGEPLRPTEPSRARKLIREAATYASTLGLRPHRGFVAIEGLFGEIRAEDCHEEFVFGCDGRPVYAPGPTESPAQIERRLSRLIERLGPAGFDVALPALDDALPGDGESEDLPPLAARSA